MKWIVMTALLLAGAATNAQEFEPDLDKIIANSKRLKFKQDTLGKIPNPFSYNQRHAEPKIVKPVPGIYNLPQDGMPCIVPDTNGIAAIPNAAKKLQVPAVNQIPNPIQEKKKYPELKNWSK